MIRYALVCDKGHEFESWFPSSEDYQKQRDTGLVSCPICNSPRVDKQIMAPFISRSEPAPVTAPAPSDPDNSQPVTLISENEQQVRAALRALRKHIKENAEDVGDRFPNEARRMHEGEIETRSIYGKASLEETQALIDEGIDIMPLPILPDEQN